MKFDEGWSLRALAFKFEAWGWCEVLSIAVVIFTERTSRRAESRV